MTELLHLLEQNGPQLTQQVLNEMYQNPFWGERYGDRGHKNSTQDNSFHLAYLVQALQARDPGVLTRYAQWLQKLLTTRGMCSRHLAENFRRLAEALQQREWPDVSVAASYLREAEKALLYPAGLARALQDRAEAITHQVSTATHAPIPEDDVRDLLSYLADAVALESSKTFEAHVAWFASFRERHHRLDLSLAQVLDSLSAVLPQALAPGEAAVAVDYVNAARRGLA